MADTPPTKTPAEAGPVQTEEEEVLSTEDATLSRSASGYLLHLNHVDRVALRACVSGAYPKYVKTRPERDYHK